jgi:replicative DNA helicase
VEAEQALVGSLMIDATAWARVVGQVRTSDLFRADHRLIFDAIATLASRGQQIDVVTVKDYLEQTGGLHQAGGLAYLSSIARNTPTAANAATYARIVRDCRARRELASFGVYVERSVADGRGRTAEELVADMVRRLLALQTGARTGKGLVSSDELARELIDDLDRRREKAAGLATGLADFDAITGGLEPGDLVVIAARPGMGKTSLLVTIAAQVARTVSTAVFSAEMPALQLMRRCVALIGGIPQTRLRRADQLTEADWSAIYAAAGKICERSLGIDDTPAPTLSHIRAEAYARKARHGLGLLLVDYVQLVQGTGATRYEQLRDVAYGLKALAKDLSVPIIVLAQLNRGVESRDQKRPHMSDLRDSGAIEEAADIVGLLFSEGYYDRDFGMPQVLECTVAKNRNGERGECLWHFAGEFSRVTALEDGSRAQYRHLRAKRKRADVDGL